MRSNPDFVIVPFDVLTDERLTLRQIRVLMAILSWRKRNTNLSAVSREMISERTGYPLTRISAITRELEQLGYIKKHGDGGRSKWSKYELLDPETVTKTVTVTKTETVTDLALNGYQNGNQTVTDSVTRIHTERRQKEDRKNNKSAGAPADHAKPKKQELDFSSWPELPSEDVWRDYVAHRKNKKATITQTVINRLGTELHKASAMGYSVDDCLSECMMRGWQGFKAEWIQTRHQSRSDKISKASSQLDDLIRQADAKILSGQQMKNHGGFLE